MKEYLFIYRIGEDATQAMAKSSPEEMQAVTQQWMDWIGGIAAQNKLAQRGNRLFPTGKVVRPGNVVADGPYAEIKEFISGYSIVKAESIDDAANIAASCPGLKFGGNVEIREINQM